MHSRRKTATEIWISSLKYRSDAHIHLGIDTVAVSTNALQPCRGRCLLADLPLRLTAVTDAVWSLLPARRQVEPRGLLPRRVRWTAPTAVAKWGR